MTGPTGYRISFGIYEAWREAAQKAADAAYALYDRDSVEYELALYLLRALRELERRS